MSNNPQISRIGRTLRNFVALALALSIPVVVLAQTQTSTVMGMVTSSSLFELRGTHVRPAPGVPNWPVMSGDTFQAGDGPLTLTLFDSSAVVFAPRTRVTLGMMSNGPVIRLESGSVRYTLRDPGAINFYCKDEKIAVTSQTGEPHCGAPVSGWWVAGGAAAAAGAWGGALGLQNGPPVSPSRP